MTEKVLKVTAQDSGFEQVGSKISALVNKLKILDKSTNQAVGRRAATRAPIVSMTDGINAALDKYGTFDSLSEKIAKQTMPKVVQSIDMVGSAVTRSINKANTKIKEHHSNVRRLSGTYLQVSLSALFFGMALKRLATSILKSTVGAYDRIMESSDYLGTATQRLGVHFEYLKFVVGKAINTALEPLLPHLIRLVNWFTAIVQKNPNAVFATLVGILTGATFLFALGTIGTFLNGIGTFVASGAWNTLITKQLPYLATFAGKVIGIGIALYFTKEAFDDFTKEKFLEGIGDLLTAGGGIALATGNWAVGGALIVIGVATQLVAQGKFFKTFFTIAGVIVGILGGIVKSLWNIIYDVTKNKIAKMVNFLIDAVQPILSFFGGPDLSQYKMEVKDIGTILKDSVKDFIPTVKSFVQTGKELGTAADEELTSFLQNIGAIEKPATSLTESERAALLNYDLQKANMERYGWQPGSTVNNNVSINLPANFNYELFKTKQDYGEYIARQVLLQMNQNSKGVSN